MKKIASILFVIILYLSLCACGEISQAAKDDKLRELFTLVYNSPNAEFYEAMMKSVFHIGVGVSSEESEPENYVGVFFTPYVSEEYLSSFIGTYGLVGPILPDGSEGKSVLELFAATETDDPNGQREFSIKVNCENSRGDTKVIEITGRYRQDKEGKLISIKYNTGYGEFLSFFQ